MVDSYASVERDGNELLVRGVRADGERFRERVAFRPRLYRRGVGWETYDSILEAYAERKYNRSQLKGHDSFEQQYIHAEYPGSEPIERSHLGIVSFDIETDSSAGFPSAFKADREIWTIAATDSRRPGRMFAFGVKDYDDSGRPDVTYTRCASEEEMIEAFVETVWKDCDAVLGWNNLYYDVPFLVNRMRVLGMNERSLSPWQSVEAYMKNDRWNSKVEYNVWRVLGVSVLDGIDLYDKFAYAYPDEFQSLGDVARAVLGAGKVEYKKEFGRMATMYREDHQMFVDYNIRDVELVNWLDEEIGMVDMALQHQYLAGAARLSDVMGYTAVWDGIITKRIVAAGLVPPLKPKVDKDAGRPDIGGGYVKEPQAGDYRWVAAFDFASMYPSIMLQHKLGPGGGLVGDIVQGMFDKRQEIKREMAGLDGDERKKLDNRQMSLKILMNTLYGAFASGYFRYFDFDTAKFITSTGRRLTKICEARANEVLNRMNSTVGKDYVVGAHTDSLHILLDGVVRQLEAKHGGDERKIVQLIDEVVERVLDPVFSRVVNDFAMSKGVENRMYLNKETIASRAIWKVANRYALKLVQKDGREVDEMKVAGLEGIKGQTPDACKKKLMEAYRMILDGCAEESIWNFTDKFRIEFRQLPVADAAYSKNVKTMMKYSDPDTIYIEGSGASQEAKASLIYNYRIAALGLQNRYNLISEGDRVKFAKVMLPNGLRHDVLAFLDDEVPNELFQGDARMFLKYDTMFYDSFLKPLQSLLDVVGWSAEKPQKTLFD